MVIALKASQAETMRAATGIASPARPSGYPPPSQRSCEARTTTPTLESRPPTCCSIRSPSTVWVFMIAHSSSSSGPGLLMISSGTAILPMSCSSAPISVSRRTSSLTPISSATLTDSSTTSSVWWPVYSSSSSSRSRRSSAVPR